MAITIGSNFDLATQLPLDSRVVKADLTARDAIASGIRFDGLTVYVISELTSYQLQGGITNGDWVDLSDTGVTPVDDILDWSTNKYTPWSDANKAAGRLYTYTTTYPSNSETSLAYDGNFYATFFKSLNGFRTDSGSDVSAINATNFYLSINGTARTHFAPTTVSGQVANWLDTSSTFTAGTLLSIRNNSTEKFTVDFAGNVNIPTGATYQINGVSIGGGSSQWTTSGSDIYYGTGNVRIAGVGNALLFDTTGSTSSNYIKTENDYRMTLYCGRGNTSKVEIGNNDISFYTATALRLQIATGGSVTVAGQLEIGGGYHGTNKIRFGNDDNQYIAYEGGTPDRIIIQGYQGVKLNNAFTGTYLILGNSGITINGTAYITGNCSADSYTDRTPFYEGDALAEIMNIKGKDGQIDHNSLPSFAKVEKVKEDESIEQERDLGAMISILTVAVQQLTERLQKLEKY